MTDAQWLQLANAVCEVQSRCAIMVAGQVDDPENVQRTHSAYDQMWCSPVGVCQVTYRGAVACALILIPSALGEALWTLEVLWKPEWQQRLAA